MHRHRLGYYHDRSPLPVHSWACGSNRLNRQTRQISACGFLLYPSGVTRIADWVWSRMAQKQAHWHEHKLRRAVPLPHVDDCSCNQDECWTVGKPSLKCNGLEEAHARFSQAPIQNSSPKLLLPSLYSFWARIAHGDVGHVEADHEEAENYRGLNFSAPRAQQDMKVLSIRN